jgi:glutamate 5-kinase
MKNRLSIDFKNANRLVIKIGTSIITDEKGTLDEKFLRNIARQLIPLVKQGKEIIVVSSGAIGCGVKELGLEGMPRDIPTRQGVAAVGQSILIEAWRTAFKRYGLKVAQVLLTYESFSNRVTYLNLQNAILALMKYNAVVVVNENDSVSIHEIGDTFGDNDKLSALVAGNIDANLLILLTDVDGLYDKNPRHKDARLIRVVKKITPEIERMGGRSGSWRTRGGMKTKIDAAKIAVKSGCNVIIANAREKNVLMKIVQGKEVGTLFKPSKSSYRRKERWIMFSKCKGRVDIDSGARDALSRGKTLLPSGIVKVEGKFSPGDLVQIVHAGMELGRGVVEYSDEELRKIKGLHTDMVEKKLGYRNCDSVIKKENLTLI